MATETAKLRNLIKMTHLAKDLKMHFIGNLLWAEIYAKAKIAGSAQIKVETSSNKNSVKFDLPTVYFENTKTCIPAHILNDKVLVHIYRSYEHVSRTEHNRMTREGTKDELRTLQSYVKGKFRKLKDYAREFFNEEDFLKITAEIENFLAQDYKEHLTLSALLEKLKEKKLRDLV
jgi:hypothetical protein